MEPHRELEERLHHEEDRLAQKALSIRCLQRPDGSLAGPGDPEDDLVAIVARSY